VCVFVCVLKCERERGRERVCVCVSVSACVGGNGALATFSGAHMCVGRVVIWPFCNALMLLYEISIVSISE